MIAENDNELRLKMSEGLFNDAYTRLLDLYALSTAERYRKLIAKWPALLQHVSLKQLASYLRITPTHLSRIRKAIK
ncbi:MAG: hypothetical protein LIP02_06105 [Bacteroidales bacterium]|nr:hypothetical protein [Bacteroidales bacterium]